MSLMNTQGHHFLSNSRLAQYQGLLCENPQVTRNSTDTEPATFLSTEEGKPDHDCSEVTDEVYTSRPYLQDQAIQNPELMLFSDGSSYIQEGIGRAGYAVTIAIEVLEAKALLARWSAQQAKLHALSEPSPSVRTSKPISTLTPNMPLPLYTHMGQSTRKEVSSLQQEKQSRTRKISEIP